ncbi:hypothetical protein KPL70_025597 [Citrus sinensis]|nr:hypothetical protein KPL70_025597 [Citrus sinensis]
MSSPHSSSNLGISIAPKVGLQASDVLSSHFDSVEDAELWYNNYARMLGFGVRKDDMRRGKKSGRITIRRWVCHFEGVRDERQSQDCSRVREPRPITRTGCRASFRVNYDESVGKYIAKEFRPEHNHHLASNDEVHLIRSYRKVTDAELAQAKALRHVGVKTCQFMDYMADQANLKNEDFTRKFRDLMLTPMTVAEFETQWSAVVAEFALEHHAWVQKMYSKRCNWAEAYLRGTFFASMRSTQRCEKTSDEFKTKYNTFVLRTHLQSLEKHAAQLFPLRVFSKVRDEMLRKGAVIEVKTVKTVKTVDVALYTVTEFGTPTTCWNVIQNLQENHIQCSCQMMESVGLPCRHMFHVLKVEQIVKIPDNMVLRRWTKKVNEHNTCRTTKPEVDTEVSEVARFSALSAACNKMCYNTAKNVEAYANALVEINRLTLTYEQQSE